MDLNEKYSDTLAIVWNQICTCYEENNLLQENDLNTVLCIIRFMENNKVCRDKIHFENVSIILEQVVIMIYENNTREYDKEKLQQCIRDVTYLLKDQWLFRNLEKTRQSCCVIL